MFDWEICLPVLVWNSRPEVLVPMYSLSRAATLEWRSMSRCLVTPPNLPPFR
jgi:hypothetical protein